VDIGGVFEEALLDALLDDLPDGRLRKGPEVYLPLVLLGDLPSLYQGRLQLHLDEVVVRDLVDGVGYYSLEDSDVPCP
jgi:hypothetical protein